MQGMTGAQAESRTAAAREKRWVALTSVVAAFFLTGTKLAVGLLTGSLGILAEALHSGLDLVAAVMTLWAVRVSAHPPDSVHTYGHGKFENLSALFETLLLLATCVWIIWEAVDRLFFAAKVHVEASLWAFLVVAFSIVVDYGRSRALYRVAKKYDSQALEADALHFSTDIWSSAVVFLGLLGVLGAEHLDAPWLVQADSVAALGVAAIVIWVSIQLGKKTIDDLLDAVPQYLQNQIALAAQVNGVHEVKKVRVRKSGPEVFGDVTLSVERSVDFERSHEIADEVEEAIRARLPRSDVVVHVEPYKPGPEDLLTTARMLAARHGSRVHGLRIYEEDGRRSVEVHLEVSETLRLSEAHLQATAFEGALRASDPSLADVVTHIEPAGDAAATLAAEPVAEAEVRAAVHEFPGAEKLGLTPVEVRARRAGGELSVSMRCTLDASTPIIDAHDVATRLEKFLRTRIPELGRVVIHTEPAEEQPANGVDAEGSPRPSG
jgi:cation diffusion facilitator family transporter